MNKTKASDKYIVISTRSNLCEGYSDPIITTHDDYGHAYDFVQRVLIQLCCDDWMINTKKEEVKHDDKGRRIQWNLTYQEEGHYVQIVKIEPYEVDIDKYEMPTYFVYDQITNTHEWLFDYVECRCQVSTIALESRGFDKDFMRFKELTHELYEHVFLELDDMDDGKQTYVTLDDDDVCIHYYKIQYHEKA